MDSPFQGFEKKHLGCCNKANPNLLSFLAHHKGNSKLKKTIENKFELFYK